MSDQAAGRIKNEVMNRLLRWKEKLPIPLFVTDLPQRGRIGQERRLHGDEVVTVIKGRSRFELAGTDDR